MPDIRIIQLNSAPEGLWQLYAIDDGADGDAVVFLSRVVAMALVQDVDDQGNEVEQRVAPIHVGAMTDPTELYDCLKPKQSGVSMAVVHATDLPAAAELAEKWQHEVFSRALTGHDMKPGVLHAGVCEWQLDPGGCQPWCPRCEVERTHGEGAYRTWFTGSAIGAAGTLDRLFPTPSSSLSPPPPWSSPKD
ncbi:MAG: hypothetical protein M3Q47_17970 [Actinomycetota bacterium]|nr:hypothetical protein [Actinomycetota bacterium]